MCEVNYKYVAEAHNNSKEYFSSLNIEEDAIYVTANVSLANMIKINNSIKQEQCWRILDIETFIESMYPIWSNSVNKVKLKGELRLSINELRSQYNDEKMIKELKFLEDNIDLLLSEFKFFIEGDVLSINSQASNEKMFLIYKLYNNFIARKEVVRFSQELKKSLTNISEILIANFIKYMESHDKTKNVELEEKIMAKKSEIRKIYFYNLNYIDFKRFIFIERLKKNGYEVIFRVPYFNELEKTNRTWTKIYNIKRENNQFNSKKVKYVEYLEGKNNIQVIDEKIDEKVVVREYTEANDFFRVVEDNVYVTFYKDSLSSCERSKRDKENLHCFNSDVGRFLYHLYNNCKVENGEVYISFNTYREMITSGWIEYKKAWNGEKLSLYLLENSEYFLGVKTLNDIISRIENLMNLETVSKIFDEEGKFRTKQDRRKKFLSNPFKALGYLNFEDYNITPTYMYLVTLKLRDFLLRELSDENGIIEVSGHLENLKKMFHNKYMVEKFNNGSEEERKIISRIFTVLSNKKRFLDTMHKEDIFQLFGIYLNLDRNRRDKEQDFSIDQLEGIILNKQLFSNNNKIFISDLSFKAFDKYINKYTLSEKILTWEDTKDIMKTNSKFSKDIIIRGIAIHIQSKEAFKSYYKFAIANLLINFKGEIEFSWIKRLRQDDTKSIILTQIESLYDKAKIVKQKIDVSKFYDEDLIIDNTYIYDKNEIRNKNKEFPEVAFRDLDFCGDKFLYSSVLKEHPVYYSDFHNRLIFSVLVSIIKNNMQDGYSEIYKHVFPLFPQWTEAYKKNILDCEFSRKNLYEYKFFQGINYPKVIDKLYILKSKYVVTEKSKIRNRYNKGEFDGKRYYNEFIDEYLKGITSHSGLHCKMCPHCYICKRGAFIIDYK